MINAISNSPNFKSRPIYDANLRKINKNGNCEYVKAVFAELSPKDITDRNAMQFVSSAWEKAKYVGKIGKNFLGQFPYQKDTRHFSLELSQNEGSLAEKIVGLLELITKEYKECKELHISHLQANPDFMFKNKDSSRDIKGIGEMFLNGVFKLAKKEKACNVSLLSTNDDFYYKTFKNAGINLFEEDIGYDNNGLIEIKEKDFEKYIKYSNEKYNL